MEFSSGKRDTRIDLNDVNNFLARAPKKPQLQSPSGRARSDKDLPNQDLRLHPLKLPTIVEFGHENLSPASGALKPQIGTPWQRYQRQYKLGALIMATEISDSCDRVNVREQGDLKEEDISILCRLSHNTIVNNLQVFTDDNTTFMVLEYMPIYLGQVINCGRYPTEMQLAAILGQVVPGLCYLEVQGLQHGSLSKFNILLAWDGSTKFYLEHPKHQTDNSRHDMKALSLITMELMQKYSKDGAVGVDDLDRWPLQGCAVDFLSATATYSSAQAIQKHALLKLAWRKDCLKGLISFAAMTAWKDVSA